MLTEERAQAIVWSAGLYTREDFEAFARMQRGEHPRASGWRVELAAACLLNRPRCWDWEPGDDDGDDDELELPLGEVLDRFALGLAHRPQTDPLDAFDLGAWRSDRQRERESTIRLDLEETLAWAEPRLELARAEFRALSRAGLHTAEDAAWGRALAGHVTWARAELLKLEARL